MQAIRAPLSLNSNTGASFPTMPDRAPIFRSFGVIDRCNEGLLIAIGNGKDILLEKILKGKIFKVFFNHCLLYALSGCNPSNVVATSVFNVSGFESSSSTSFRIFCTLNSFSSCMFLFVTRDARTVPSSIASYGTLSPGSCGRKPLTPGHIRCDAFLDSVCTAPVA